ncbi:hypothetical protein [Enterococcus sp. DIV0660C]|uniref:hypothetical protein n=1 Tax=Enterococcus sp. DIV0660C TaxID=2230880 RepID=UPI001A8EDFC7|nr:hypothetical protein [Enterococcus sp. DIV0660C]MBO0430728.1 hypothetical protein [Enterococcus sp. DIV0660C]
MTISFTGTIKKDQTIIELADGQGTLTISSKKVAPADNSFELYFQNRHCIGIDSAPKEFDTLILVSLPWEMEANYLSHSFFTLAEENNLTVSKPKDIAKQIPANVLPKIEESREQFLRLLTTLGYSFLPTEIKKKKPGKARHRWSKEVSKIPFTVHFRDSKATIYWKNRNEMLVKKGAIMMTEAPLNKDGSVSYAAKYGDKLRADHQENISGNKTTADIILKSVNEVSLFLYFGGTNSWLEILDENGKSLDEWTRVD